MPDPPPSLHIDIQIHINADTTSEQIERIFKAMREHLLDLTDATADESEDEPCEPPPKTPPF